MARKSTKRATVKPQTFRFKDWEKERHEFVVKNPAAPVQIDIPGKDPWYRSILTDHNGDFDMGAVLVGVVALFMCANAGFDTIVLHSKFNAQEFGIGIAAMLGGFAAYKWGDAKRPPGTTTTTAVQTQTTTNVPRD